MSTIVNSSLERNSFKPLENDSSVQEKMETTPFDFSSETEIITDSFSREEAVGSSMCVMDSCTMDMDEESSVTSDLSRNSSADVCQTAVLFEERPALHKSRILETDSTLKLGHKGSSSPASIVAKKPTGQQRQSRRRTRNPCPPIPINTSITTNQPLSSTDHIESQPLSSTVHIESQPLSSTVHIESQPLSATNHIESDIIQPQLSTNHVELDVDDSLNSGVKDCENVVEEVEDAMKSLTDNEERRKLAEELWKDLNMFQPKKSTVPKGSGGVVDCGGSELVDSQQHSGAFASFMSRQGDLSPPNPFFDTGVSCGTDAACNPDDIPTTDLWGNPLPPRQQPGVTDMGADSSRVTTTMATQADPMKMFLEGKLMSFIRDPHQSEYRINGRLKPEAKVALKMISSEHELLIRSFGRGKDQYVLVRKKASLWDVQQEGLRRKAEEAKLAKKAQIQKIKQLEEEMARLKRGEKLEEEIPPEPAAKEMCIQADLDVDEGTVAPERAGVMGPVPKGARPPAIESFMQTCPDGFYICPYCEEDIPEEAQEMHHSRCLITYRVHRMEKARASALNPNNGKSGAKSRDARSKSRDARSKSRGRVGARSKSRSGAIEIVDPKDKLDSIHSNDVETMIRTVQHMDSHCAAKKCKAKAEMCSTCKRSFCHRHISSHACRLPVVKPLTPLYKKPPPPDGVMLNRHRAVTKPDDNPSPTENTPPIQSEAANTETEPSANGSAAVEQETPGVIRFSNKTEYRNYLKKHLREKLSTMAARRS